MGRHSCRTAGWKNSTGSKRKIALRRDKSVLLQCQASRALAPWSCYWIAIICHVKLTKLSRKGWSGQSKKYVCRSLRRCCRICAVWLDGWRPMTGAQKWITLIFIARWLGQWSVVNGCHAVTLGVPGSHLEFQYAASSLPPCQRP